MILSRVSAGRRGDARIVHRLPTEQMAAYSSALQRVASLGMSKAERFIAVLESPDDTAAKLKRIRTIEAQAFAQLSRAVDGAKLAEPSTLQTVLWVFDRVAAIARRRKVDLRTLLVGGKADRSDAKRLPNPKRVGQRLKREFGVDLDDPFIRRTLKEHARENAKLVTKMSKQQIRRISDATSEAVQKGWSKKQLTDRIAEIGDITKRHARLIASDQTMKLSQAMTSAICDEVGVEHYIWITMEDDRVRPSHEKLHGKRRKFGAGIEPGEEVNCRCIAEPDF